MFFTRYISFLYPFFQLKTHQQPWYKIFPKSNSFFYKDSKHKKNEWKEKKGTIELKTHNKGFHKGQQHIFFSATFQGEMWFSMIPASLSFFYLNNSLHNKWFNFKIPFWNIYTIILFLTCILIGYLKFITFKFYHVLSQGQTFDL